jgi:hypothetical protein
MKRRIETEQRYCKGSPLSPMPRYSVARGPICAQVRTEQDDRSKWNDLNKSSTLIACGSKDNDCLGAQSGDGRHG